MLAGQASYLPIRCAPMVEWTGCIAGIGGERISERASYSGVVGERSEGSLLWSPWQK
jgi:hypothetical protein